MQFQQPQFFIITTYKKKDNHNNLDEGGATDFLTDIRINKNLFTKI